MRNTRRPPEDTLAFRLTEAIPLDCMRHGQSRDLSSLASSQSWKCQPSSFQWVSTTSFYTTLLSDILTSLDQNHGQCFSPFREPQFSSWSCHCNNRGDLRVVRRLLASRGRQWSDGDRAGITFKGENSINTRSSRQCRPHTDKVSWENST